MNGVPRPMGRALANAVAKAIEARGIGMSEPGPYEDMRGLMPMSPEECEADFYRIERQSRDTIDVKRVYVDLAGDLVSGVLLSQVIYWFIPARDGARKPDLIERDDGWWLPRARDEWWAECRLTAKQFDAASAILVEAGLIEKAVRKRSDGTPVMFVRPCVLAIYRGMRAEGGKSTFPNRESPLSQIGKVPCARPHPDQKESTGESTSTSREGGSRDEPESRDLPGETYERAVRWVSGHQEQLVRIVGTLNATALTEIAEAAEFAIAEGLEITPDVIEWAEKDARRYQGRVRGCVSAKVFAVALRTAIKMKLGIGENGPATAPGRGWQVRRETMEETQARVLREHEERYGKRGSGC